MEVNKARSEATFQFTVHEIRNLPENHFVSSPSYYIRNLPWKIMVRRTSSEKSFSYFLQCQGEASYSFWSCYAKAELRLISHKPDSGPFLRKIDHLFCNEEYDWGFKHFISWNDVLDPEKGYIQDNAITLEVHVVADAPHGVSCDLNKPKMVELKLNFDTMDTDTKLAEEYIKKYESEWTTDSYSSLQFCIREGNNDDEVLPRKLKNLTEKIEENSELFAQLEFLIRKIPKEDVLTYDISLLTQALLDRHTLDYDSTAQVPPQVSSAVRMSSCLPLATLGLAGQALYWYGKANIFDTPQTAAICYLFRELCDQVGLISEKKFVKKQQDKEQKAVSCGIVTELSDLDSAVDVFLSSSTTHPWKLQRVWIQESIYELFKDTIKWKCNLKQSEVALEPKLKSLCSEVYVYEQKVFFLDFAGDSTQLTDTSYQPVLVEAYRTTKELISLLAKYELFAASVWSANVSTANELALNIKAPLVWVNDYANFSGSPKTSRAFYTNFKAHIPKTPKVDNILKLHKSWTKLNLKDRVGMVSNAVKKIKDEELRKILSTFDQKMENECKKFVEIEDNMICIGIEECAGLVAIESRPVNKGSHLAFVVNSVIEGNAVFFCGNDFPFTEAIECFERENIPVTILHPQECADKEISGEWLSISCSLYKTRVIRTNFGTIFAN